MTDYIKDQWYGWNNGECPVHPETVVEVTSGSARHSQRANQTNWGAVIAFRIVTPYVEPKLECWVNVYETWLSVGHQSKEKADYSSTTKRVRCIRMIEVDEQ